MTDEEKIQMAIDAFDKLHSKEVLTEEQLQIIKDLICGRSLYNGNMLTDTCFWLIINSTLETIYDNFKIVEESMVRYSYCSSYGIPYSM